MIQKFNHLTKEEAEALMEEWISNGHKLQKLDVDYEVIRSTLNEIYNYSLKQTDNQGKSDYLLDITFGIGLYDYLNNKEWFSLREAANDDFWRYLSVVILPNVVAERWGEDNADHIWKRSGRIWLKTIWWYIYLSFNKTSEETFRMLSEDSFNTDIILNLVERTGRKGTYVDVYRKIMYYYSLIPKSEIERYRKSVGDSHDNLFRSLMRLNTVRLMVIDPLLVKGGADAYVRTLIEDLHISL